MYKLAIKNFKSHHQKKRSHSTMLINSFRDCEINNNKRTLNTDQQAAENLIYFTAKQQ